LCFVQLNFGCFMDTVTKLSVITFFVRRFNRLFRRERITHAVLQLYQASTA
jgi:hypothetical protein